MPEVNLKKYFLPYQVEDILCEDRLMAWEKSIRIGATYSKSFRAVRRRLLRHGDYLHSSVSLPAALEFINVCKSWHPIFGIAALSMGEIDWDDSIEGKAYQITYDNGQRIIAFSSNPNSIRSFGGEVGIDEIAFHKNPKAMRQAAGGRAMWGYPVSIWSSHNGVESDWNEFLTEQKKKGAAALWKVRTTTLPEAVEQGLVEKINETRKTHFTREQFIKETIELVGGMEAYEEECLCLPRKSGNVAIRWQFIEGARQDYDPYRLRLTGDDPVDLESSAGKLLDDLRTAPACAMGYDVGRTGDLSVLWVNQKLSDAKWKLAALITMKNRRFAGQRDIAETLMSRVPSLVAAGDKTGLGMQICEELTDKFGEARFVGMNFSATKSDIGTKLTRVYEDGRQIIPAGADYAEIPADLSGIRTESTTSGRTRFYEVRNAINKDSHCDIAWANGLAIAVGEDEIGVGAIAA